MQKHIVGLLSYTIYKINFKWITNLNIRAKVIKFLEEKRVKNHDLIFGNDFLDMIP